MTERTTTASKQRVDDGTLVGPVSDGDGTTSEHPRTLRPMVWLETDHNDTGSLRRAPHDDRTVRCKATPGCSTLA